MSGDRCIVPGCGREGTTHGLCSAHYLRSRRHLRPGELEESLVAWKGGRSKWPGWMTKAFAAPRGQSANGKPPASVAPETTPEERKKAALKVAGGRDMAKALAAAPSVVAAARAPAKRAAMVSEGLAAMAVATQSRPAPQRVLDPVLKRRVDGLRETADFLCRITDTSATKKAVLAVLAIGTIGVPFQMEEALQELERSAKVDGWVA